MRTYGRLTLPDGSKKWVKVETDANGNSDEVYIVTLAQQLLLNLGESPFYGNYGIPAQNDVMQQIYPDYYVTLVQQRWAPFFAILNISRRNVPTPTYDIAITTKAGATLNYSVPIPQ